MLYFLGFLIKIGLLAAAIGFGIYWIITEVVVPV